MPLKNEKQVRTLFAQQCIRKNNTESETLFAGRNLPTFVRDFILRRHVDGEGNVDRQKLTEFLDRNIPSRSDAVRSELESSQDVCLLTRLVVKIDLTAKRRTFGIPDYNIKNSETLIPEWVVREHEGELTDGEHWGLVKLCLSQNLGGKGYHVEMTDFKAFKPYRSVDVAFWRQARAQMTTEAWIDLLLSCMEYEPSGFGSSTTKLEFLSRLLVMVEANLNMVELAPKGTGKSRVFGNLSKYGWLVSGGKLTRSKLFYDKTRQQPGIIKGHDYLALDEVQTIVFQEPAELQAALKSYLESGKTTIDNIELTSECGVMLMGNIPLDGNRRPLKAQWFDSLPAQMRESALLDRFHGFIRGWLLPRIDTNLVFEGWTLNAEYFSEVLHALRSENVYSVLFGELVRPEERADLRDVKAVRRLTSAYHKLLFPHWVRREDVDEALYREYCLQPAIERRRMVREQIALLDAEFKAAMPEFRV